MRWHCNLRRVLARLGGTGVCFFQKNLLRCALLETLPFTLGSSRTLFMGCILYIATGNLSAVFPAATALQTSQASFGSIGVTRRRNLPQR